MDICLCGKTIIMAKETKHKIQIVLTLWVCDWGKHSFNCYWLYSKLGNEFYYHFHY